MAGAPSPVWRPSRTVAVGASGTQLSAETRVMIACARRGIGTLPLDVLTVYQRTLGVAAGDEVIVRDLARRAHSAPSAPGVAPASLSQLLELDAEAFLVGAYALLLGREADSDGFCHYLGALLDGECKEQVLWHLMRSPECVKRADHSRLVAELQRASSGVTAVAAFGRRLRRLARWAWSARRR